MKSLAHRIVTDTPAQFAAVVIRAEGPRVALRHGDGVTVATRAWSCLAAPQAGDRALVATVEGERWVLAVLERPGAAGVAIESDGDIELRATHGRVVASAAEGVAVLTPGEATLAAGEMTVHARAASVAVERAEVIAGSLTERAERVYRAVTEVEQVRARRVDYAVEESLRMHAGDAVITSDRLVKIDGEQVHLG